MRRAALIAAVAFLPLPLAAQDDSTFLSRMIEDSLSDAGREVRVIGFEGALSSRARVAEITIADADGIWLSLRGVELDWRRAALLSRRIEVNSLTAAEIDLPRLPVGEPGAPSPEAQVFSLPELPVSVQIGTIEAARVTLGAPVLGVEAVVRLEGAADLAGGEGHARLAVERIDGMEGQVAFEGAFSNITRVLALDLGLVEAPGGIASGLIGLPGEPALDLAISGEGPVSDFAADIRLASDGQERLTGRVGLNADRDAEGEVTGHFFAADLSGDVAPLFMPEYRDFFGDDLSLRAAGRRSANGALNLTELRLAAERILLEGRAIIASDGLPFSFDLALDIAARDGEPVLLPLPGDPFRVDGARLRLDYHGTRDEGWRLDGQLAGFDRPDLRIETLSLSGSGRIGRAGGRVVGGALDFAAGGIAPADPALAEALGPEVRGAARFSWRGGERLRLPQLTVEGQGYRAEVRARLTDLSDALHIAAEAGAEVDDFARFSALAGRPLGGSGRIDWNGTVEPLSGAFDGELSVAGQGIAVDIAELDALLSGESRIDLSAARTGEGTEIRALDISAATLSATARGWLRSEASDLTARLDFSDLSVLGAGYGGALAADATLVQEGGIDRVTLTSTGQDLRAGQEQADNLLRGLMRLDLRAERAGDLVRIEDLRLAGASLSARASGEMRGETRNLTATANLPDLAAMGRPYGGALTATLDYAAASGRETVTLNAEGRDLSVGQAQADRLMRGASVLSLTGHREGGVMQVEGFRFDNPQMTARADAQIAGSARHVDVEARLATLALFVPEIPGPVTLTGRIDDTGAGYVLDLTSEGPGGIGATTQGRIAPDLSSANLRLNGRSEAALANAFTGPVSVQGPVSFDLVLDGPLALSSVSGRVNLSDARLALLDPAMAFRGLNVTADLAGGRVQIAARATAETGGTVQVNGPVGLTAPFPAELTVDLDRLVLRDPSLYSTSAQGQIRVTGPLTGGGAIAGRILLPETEIQVPSTGLGGFGSMPDLRHVNEPAAVRATRARAGLLEQAAGGTGGPSRPFALDLAVDAPNRIFVRGRGLDAELGGAIHLGGTTADILPTGGFELLRGRLDLLGQRFTLSEGRLTMEGRFIPYVRLAATTRADSVEATVLIDGPATEPTISFLSSPEMPEEEVVARLLFGRGLTGLSPLQAAQLASAVATLTGRGGGGVVDRMRRSVGLDDLDFTTGEDGAAAVRAGRYLSSNLYADVVIGTDGTSEVNLNLDVTNSLTVRGRAGSDGTTGIGLYFERDY